MKNVVRLLVCVLLVTIYTSCEKESEIVVQENEASLQISTENEVSLKNLISEMVTQSEANGKISYTTLNYSNKDILLDDINFSTVTKAEFLAAKPSSVTATDTDFLRGGIVTITCTFPDGSTDDAECNAGDFECIGVAVQGCVNEGGCAESCKQHITYRPKNFK